MATQQGVILVTGGLGFIGLNLAKKISQAEHKFYASVQLNKSKLKFPLLNFYASRGRFLPRVELSRHSVGGRTKQALPVGGERRFCNRVLLPVPSAGRWAHASSPQ